MHNYFIWKEGTKYADQNNNYSDFGNEYYLEIIITEKVFILLLLVLLLIRVLILYFKLFFNNVLTCICSSTKEFFYFFCYIYYYNYTLYFYFKKFCLMLCWSNKVVLFLECFSYLLSTWLEYFTLRCLHCPSLKQICHFLYIYMIDLCNCTHTFYRISKTLLFLLSSVFIL